MNDFEKAFNDRILFVTEGKSKDWEEGYNTMVIATKLLLEEIKLHIEANYLPLSTLKQVIEGMEKEIATEEHNASINRGLGIGSHPKFIYNQALSDILQSIKQGEK